MLFLHQGSPGAPGLVGPPGPPGPTVYIRSPDNNVINSPTAASAALLVSKSSYNSTHIVAL